MGTCFQWWVLRSSFLFIEIILAASVYGVGKMKADGVVVTVGVQGAVDKTVAAVGIVLQLPFDAFVEGVVVKNPCCCSSVRKSPLGRTDCLQPKKAVATSKQRKNVRKKISSEHA